MKNYYCGLGWKHNIQSHTEYFEEIAYSLADKGYTLRTIGNKGGSTALIKGVQRYCSNRKLDLNDYLEVYMPSSQHNGVISDQDGFYNVHDFKNIIDAKKITTKFAEPGVTVLEREFKLLCCTPYLCLGKKLDQPSQFLITDIKLYKKNTQDIIIDAHGINGQAIRTINKLSPKSHVFNFDYEPHRQRLNNLIYHAKK